MFPNCNKVVIIVTMAAWWCLFQTLTKWFMPKSNQTLNIAVWFYFWNGNVILLTVASDQKTVICVLLEGMDQNCILLLNLKDSLHTKMIQLDFILIAELINWLFVQTLNLKKFYQNNFWRKLQIWVLWLTLSHITTLIWIFSHVDNRERQSIGKPNMYCLKPLPDRTDISEGGL